MRPKPENQLSVFTAYMCLLSVCTKRQLESQQTVYRGPDGKQLCTQLCSLCPLLRNPVVTVSEKPHKQHVNKLVQPRLNKDFTDINKHWPLCGPWTITCQQQNIHNLFSRKCLIQLGFHSFKKKGQKRLGKSDSISVFQSAWTHNTPKYSDMSSTYAPAQDSCC